MNSESRKLLEVKRLTKRFAGNIALDEVDFEVNAGEVHALLGENGAGKSTLIKILAGVHRPDDGEIRMKGRVVDPLVDKLPMTFIHQDLGLVNSMSVAENVAVVAGYPRWRGLISWAATRAAATAAVERMGGGVDANARVGDLSAAEKSIVAIARAMAVNCDLLVLDEPSAALPEADVARLLDVLRRLRESGVGIVYVTHRLDEVFRIADRVTVLRDGRRVATERVGDTNPKDLIYEIVGRSLSNLFPTPPVHGADIVLEVEDLVAGDVGPISFRLAGGEILGLVGLRGAGHATVGRAIFGDAPVSRGSLSLAGAAVSARSPREAIGRQIGFISSKRGEESVAPNMSVRENLYMNPTTVGRRVLGADQRGRGGGAMLARSPAVLRATPRSRTADRQSLGGQSTKGGCGAMVGSRQPVVGAGGTDFRGRRRLQSGDLSDITRSSLARSRSAARLLRLRRGRGHIPPRADI